MLTYGRGRRWIGRADPHFDDFLLAIQRGVGGGVFVEGEVDGCTIRDISLRRIYE
jgi:hypothetical protein